MMPSIILFFLIALGSLESTAQENNKSIEGPVKFSLEEAKKFAVNNNFKVKSYSQKVEASIAGKKRSRSSYYPTFGVAGGVDHQSAGEVSERVPLAYGYANINLFNGFRDVYNSQLADLVTEKSRIELESEKFEVELDTEEQFHRFIYFRDLIKIKKEALTLNEKHQKLVAKTKAMGQVSPTDVMEFKLKESVVRSQLVSMNQGLESARIHLRRLLGEEIGSKIEPVGNLQHQRVQGELMTYLDKIKKHSIKIKMASKNQTISSLRAKRWRSEWMPKIDFQAQAGLVNLDSRPENSETSDSALNFQLIAKVDLFSGMDTYWQREESKALQKSSASDLKHEILMSITEMEESFRELKSIEQRVDLELGNEKLRRQYYDEVLKEYKRGYKNSSDLSAAAEELFETKSRQINFKYEFLRKRLAFERSYGAPIRVEVVKETANQSTEGVGEK